VWGDDLQAGEQPLEHREIGAARAAGMVAHVSWVQAALRGADRRELPLAVGLALVLLVDGLFQPDAEIASPIGAAGALVLAIAPLLWRRSAPQPALVAGVAGALLAGWALNAYDVVILPVMVCAYSVALGSDRQRTVLTGMFTAAAAIGGVALYLDIGATWVDMVLNGVLVLLAVVTGDAVRARRAFRESQRAREVEREREQQAEGGRLVAEERLRIAQDVHDVVAHAMVAISVQAGAAAHVADRRPEQARVALREIKDAADVALADLSQTLGLLRDETAPAPLRPTDGLAGLEGLAVPLRAAGITVEVTITGPEDSVAPAVRSTAFRIAQEATTNILRHAGARRASLTVEIGEQLLVLVVQDDGAALVPVGGPLERGSGNGLRGMRERAAALGGRLDAGRRSDGTWRVRAELPLR
jgi:signal transduction histidine kinase